jgi:hypothetical protein
LVLSSIILISARAKSNRRAFQFEKEKLFTAENAKHTEKFKEKFSDLNVLGG